jgi:hypothetical protein
MATYRLPPRLTLLEWEKTLRQGPFGVDGVWPPVAAADGVHLDFSAVEFADFAALAGALLVLDAAVRARIPATVTLPMVTTVNVGDGFDPGLLGERSGPTGSEVPAQTARQARARGDALAFMRQVGFLDSLRAPHWAAGTVRIVADATDRLTDDSAEHNFTVESNHDLRNAPYRRRRAFPFRWLEPMPAARLRESESFLAVSAGLEDLGLSYSDAQTLSQTVLTELVENVVEHAAIDGRPPYVLVGAILLSAETYSFRQVDLYAPLGEISDLAIADGSLVLRLIVADSGADFAALVAEDGSGRGGTVAVSVGQPVLRALGSEPATGDRTETGSSGPRGLWWVARVVRSYRGGVLVRTADLLAGVLFARTTDGSQVAESGYGHIPGTLLEITLPTGPHPRRLRKSWGSLSSSGTEPWLTWVNCKFHSRRGLSSADRAKIAGRVRAADPAPPGAGLVITIPSLDYGKRRSDDEWRLAVQRILQFASQIAGMAVVLVFPDTAPHVLEPCVAAFNADVELEADTSIGRSVLVLGCRGNPFWCGGPRALRAVLSAVSSNEGAISTAEAREVWHMAGGERESFARILRDHGYLLVSRRGRLESRLTPRGVYSTVEEAVNSNLADAITRGSSGVRRGVFRGPTLRITDRWIDVGQLLESTIGLQLAAFVLARKIEAISPVDQQPGALAGLLQVATAPRQFIRHLSECLDLGGDYYSQRSELDISEPPVGERVPAGAQIVLCTDLISTENTARRAAARVAGGDAEPTVIACVVDARDRPGEVRLLNRAIPVVSLTEVSIGLDATGSPIGRPITDIDPLLLQPVTQTPAWAPQVQEADLLRWMGSDPDVLRLGHIDSPPHRHYSVFIRLQALRAQQRRDEITDSVLSTLWQALDEVGVATTAAPVGQAAIAIWYIAADTNSRLLAEAVYGRLTAEGVEVKSVVPVPRWTAGGGWAFPARLSGSNQAGPIAIIHWSAITGDTLLHMVRLAASKGASRIVAVCMLNQMNAQDAEILRMLRAVSGPTVQVGRNARTDHGSVPESRPPSVPVAIRFVTVSSIAALDVHDCPICATRERYEVGSEAMPPRLVRHAGLLRNTLRIRDIDEVSLDAAADLFSVPVSGDEGIDYLRWRGLLLRSLRDLKERQDVIDRLRLLTDEGQPIAQWTRAGLIRLLAAEQQWLRLPPLHLQTARHLLLQVCVRGLEQLTAPPWLRVQALIVASAASPQGLVDLLPRLLSLVAHETVLMDQLLLDCYRLLLHPPHDAPVDVERLRHNLVFCRDLLERQRLELDAVDDHLHAIGQLIIVADYRIARKPQDAQAAWDRLREDLVRPVASHRLEGDLLVVRGFVEDVARQEPTTESARKARLDWDACARKLEERALVNLPPLRDILSGDFISDWVGRRDQRRLLSLAHPDVGELQAVADRLHRLSASWRPADPAWLTLRRELLDRINWWHRTFLATHLPDHDDMPALLVELIQSAPIKLAACVSSALAAHQVHVVGSRAEMGDVRIFCPEKLVYQTVEHLLENIHKHRISGATCQLSLEYSLVGSESVEFTLRNSGTRPSSPPGHGIRALREKLRPFGGSLWGQIADEGEWTFAAVARFSLWHGG